MRQSQAAASEAIRINGDLFRFNEAEIKRLTDEGDTASVKMLRDEQSALKAAHQKLLKRALGEDGPVNPPPTVAPAAVTPSVTPAAPAPAPATEAPESKESARERYLRNFNEAKKISQGG